jgi:colicin import membrane protein
MKNWFAAVLLGTLSLLACGQGNALLVESNEVSTDAARVSIAAQRLEQSQAFDQEDRACWSRFAVTACQNDVALRRRAVLADLRRQELGLNEAARKAAGREQIEQLKAKASENAARQTQRAATPPDQTRQKAQPKEVRNIPATGQSPSTDIQNTKTVEVVNPAVLAETRRAYAAKQEALILRRQERDKRLQTPSKLGLPTPP